LSEKRPSSDRKAGALKTCALFVYRDIELRPASGTFYGFEFA
jgi:hypothetical protein